MIDPYAMGYLDRQNLLAIKLVNIYHHKVPSNPNEISADVLGDISIDIEMKNTMVIGKSIKDKGIQSN